MDTGHTHILLTSATATCRDGGATGARAFSLLALARFFPTGAESNIALPSKRSSSHANESSSYKIFTHTCTCIQHAVKDPFQLGNIVILKYKQILLLM